MAYKTMREVLDSNVELNRGSLERFGLRSRRRESVQLHVSDSTSS
jgi:hypothetical protein